MGYFDQALGLQAMLHVSPACLSLGLATVKRSRFAMFHANILENIFHLPKSCRGPNWAPLVEGFEWTNAQEEAAQGHSHAHRHQRLDR